MCTLKDDLLIDFPFGQAGFIRFEADSPTCSTNATEIPVVIAESSKASLRNVLADAKYVRGHSVGRLAALPEVVEQFLCTDISESNCIVTFTEQVLEIGLDKLLKIESPLGPVSYRFSTSGNRNLELKITISTQFPFEPPVFSCDELPQRFSFHWQPAVGRLAQLVAKFGDFAASFDAFWDEMQDVDDLTMSVRPVEQPMIDCSRRILVDAGVFLDLTVDPVQPRAMPVLKLSGDGRRLTTLSSLLDGNCEHWNEEWSIVQNLEHILQQALPMDSSSQCLQEDATCIICQCGSWTEEGAVCSRCLLRFHLRCLYQSLIRNRRVKRSLVLGSISGPCPHCKQEISIKIPKLY